MIKVICIDNEIRPHSMYREAASKLKVGETYEAYQAGHPMGYFLCEIPTINPAGFAKDRFIPLSNIDETELIKEREVLIEKV